MIICDICGAGGMMNQVVLGWQKKVNVVHSEQQRDMAGGAYHLCEACSKELHKKIEEMKGDKDAS